MKGNITSYEIYNVMQLNKCDLWFRQVVELTWLRKMSNVQERNIYTMKYTRTYNNCTSLVTNA
jgi:hypothetical protein